MYLEHADLSKYYVIDIETDEIPSTKLWCLVQQNVATEVIHTFVGPEAIKRWWSELPSDAVLVGHNALSFDVPTLNRLLNLGISLDRVVDTLVLSYLYNPHLPKPESLKGDPAGPHSLKAWGHRFKDFKGDYSDWSKYTPEMLEYCIQDVKLTRRVFLALVERLRAVGFSERSAWIEHKIRIVVDKQEERGVKFDVERARNLYSLLRQREQDLALPIRELFPAEEIALETYQYRLKQDGTPYASYDKHVEKYGANLRHNLDGTYTVYGTREFNIGSPVQRVERLLSLGWEPRSFTPTGNPKVDEDALVAFAESSGRPEVRAIADWLVANGRGNMVNTWLGAVKSDGRIHGRVFTCGAITRRMRHNSPNTANIPGNKAAYGYECRSLWTASPGRVLVGYDASSIEMRMFGHYLGNKEAAELYIHGKPHIENAKRLSDALGFEVPSDNTGSKRDFYAFLYGAADKKLGGHYGKSSTVGKLIRATLIENTPGLKELSKRIENEAKSGWIKCVDGGYVRSLSSHAALNSKLQSAGGIAMKVASIFLDERIEKNGWDAWKVMDVHDESQLDTDPKCADIVGAEATQCLRDAGEFLNLTVPLDGEYKIGKTWAETH